MIENKEKLVMLILALNSIKESPLFIAIMWIEVIWTPISIKYTSLFITIPVDNGKQGKTSNVDNGSNLY